MADSLNTPTLSKLHQALSRRSLMRGMTSGAALLAVPASAIASPVPTPHQRLMALIEELKILASQMNPAIDEWRVTIDFDDSKVGCPLLIAAFQTPVDRNVKVGVSWRMSPA